MTRIWLIPDTSSGLGRALADEVLRRGDALVPDVAGRPPAAAVQAALEQFGRLDVVANLAGADRTAGELSEQGLRAELDGSLFAAARLADAVLPVFRAQRAGHFLQFAPAGGWAAARAVEGFAEGLHADAAPSGVRVTVVHPGRLLADDAAPSVRRLSGDPGRAARVLADVVAGVHPPLRLDLGEDAVRRAEQSARARLQELQLWAEVGRAADGGAVRSRGLGPVLHLAVPAAG